MKPLINNLFVKESDIEKYTKVILFDSGYEGLLNNHYLTNNGFEIYMGYNKKRKKHKNDKK